ncbi:unnamed protein product [Oikopleura dioica]|uniref:Uncharacterized protein n=1 Tax=Oikopleura dioica TaxID=34765 RepID=E4YMQ2_OIKDI|nr:unnamed protein product [Oikopleura dioica]
MKTTNSEKSVNFNNEVIFSRRSDENEQTAILPVIGDLFYAAQKLKKHLFFLDFSSDADLNLLKWELAAEKSGVVSFSSGLVGFRLELRLGKTIFSADLSRELRQISPDRILKQNLAEIRNRESVEANLKTLSHFGSGSATKIQFASSSKAARGFFGFFGLDSTQHVVVVVALVSILAIGAICAAAFKKRQICRKFCRKKDAVQWPITEEIFSKVERIVHQTPSEPSNTSQPSLPPYASIECVARNEQLTAPFLLPPRYSVMNNAMHHHQQYSTFQHHQLHQHHQHQQQQQREREREQQFQAKEEIATFLRTNEPLSPLESSHAKFKSCPIIIDAQTGYCTLPPPPPTPPMSQESLNLTRESSNLAENDSFLNSTAETSLTLSQKMTHPRPTMGLAATCLRRLPIED